MKLYTKTGDGGMTSLFGGTRVPKHHIRIQSYGTVDELNSWVGVLRDQNIATNHREKLVHIQDRLFVVGSMLALDPEKSEANSGKKRMRIPEIKVKDTSDLEEEIDRLDSALPPMTHFILPGGHPAVSYCHVARTVCRRAERMITLLSEQSPVNHDLMAYINRLSDYFFVLSRTLAQEMGAVEEKWIPDLDSD
jgi:cob(I)alamin adenosyltransferase